MPTSSGFTLTEVLISLLLLCLTGLGTLSLSIVAKQQVILATQQTIALSLTAELASRISSHNATIGDYEGIHPLWGVEDVDPCSDSNPCDSTELSQFHLYSTLTASGHPQSLQLLLQPALCIKPQGEHKLLQLSWKSQAKIQFQRPASVCDLSPNRLQLSLVVP